jgi:fused signal recognition particle receptor
MFDALKKRFASFIGRTEERALEKACEKPEPKLSVKTKVKTIFSKDIRLSEDDLEDSLSELHLSLMQSDVGVEAADYFIEDIKSKLVGVEVNVSELHLKILGSLKETLLTTLNAGGSFDVMEKIKKGEKPYVMLFLGVNGTGKTTTIAKFAHTLKENGLSCVLAAGDTFRAGAIEQLEKHAQKLNVKLISHTKGADAAAVIYDAIAHARARGVDVVLADSAGRMQTNVNLMDELKKIVRVNKPSLKVFVGDALTGNDAVEQAKKFNDMVGVDAVMLTKMDADAKGGCALSIAHAIRKPIVFVGMGQSYSDLKPFDPKWFVEQIL